MNRGAARAGAVALLATALAAGVALAIPVTGVVRDKAGKPVELATVAVPALKLGTVTDEQGEFSLDLPAGSTTLIVQLMSYETARITVHVVDGLAPLRIVLVDQPVTLAEVTVAASSFGKTGKAEGPVLRRMDVLTTPGGAADLFQALRALPGSNAPVEGAAIYTRGGNPSETSIHLDGGEIGHPYHFERASGGLFSTMDAYMIKSAFYSSGGFSAKYGGALSGILDVETQDPMNLKTVSFGANVVGANLSTSWALVPDKLSFIGTLSRSYTELLFRLYGSNTDYESAPSSGNGAAKLLYRYSPTGRIAAEYMDNGDDVALTANYLNYKGRYTQTTRSKFGALQMQDVLAGRIAIRGMASGQLYDTGWQFGPIAADQTERNLQANLEAVWPLGQRHELTFGGNLRRYDTRIDGRFAADSTDYEPGAPSRRQGGRVVVDEPGVFLEDKMRIWGPLYATAGARFDHASLPGVWTADPRGAVAWRVDEHQTLRVAAGRYHQLAPTADLDAIYGNRDLAPLSADHVIAGYEWKSEFGNVRVEGYRKFYHGLVTTDSTTWFANGGSGFAHGVDVFVQGTFRKLSGWVSYGYLDSKRREGDDPREVTSPWGVTHNLTLVSRYDVSGRWQLGAKYNIASGRSYTPVVGRLWDSARQVWHPIFGDHQSASMPMYNRLDVRLTRLFSSPRVLGRPGGIGVFYCEAMNILGIPNELEYVYNSDYSQRYTRVSYFGRRIVVAGFGLSW